MSALNYSNQQDTSTLGFSIPKVKCESMPGPKIILHSPNGDTTTLHVGRHSTPNNLRKNVHLYDMKLDQIPSRHLLYPNRRYSQPSRNASFPVVIQGFFTLIFVVLVLLDHLGRAPEFATRIAGRLGLKKTRRRSKRRTQSGAQVLPI